MDVGSDLDLLQSIEWYDPELQQLFQKTVQYIVYS
jgi:hypothetical protein